MTITKAIIVERLYEYFQHMGYSRNQCVDLIESLLEIMKDNLGAGEDVLISGFGKFCVNEKADRKGRNPSTGEEMILPARRVVTFKSRRPSLLCILSAHRGDFRALKLWVYPIVPFYGSMRSYAILRASQTAIVFFEISGH